MVNKMYFSCNNKNNTKNTSLINLILIIIGFLYNCNKQFHLLVLFDFEK